MKLTMADVKRINRDNGKCFFEKGMMKFFNSRIGNTLYGNKYFVTSEKFDENSPRLYTIRLFDVNTGSVDTVGEFQGFKTGQQAISHIKGLLKEGE